MAQFVLMRGLDFGNGNVWEYYASPRTYKSFDEAIDALLSMGKKTLLDLFQKRMHVESERVCSKYYNDHCGYGFDGLVIKSEEGGETYYFIKPKE